MKTRKKALHTAGLCLVFGILWIAVSDALAHYLAPTPAVADQWQWLSGWAFIAVTVVLFYKVAEPAVGRALRGTGQVSESKSGLKSLFDALPTGVHELSLDGRIVYINEAYARMAGVPRERLLGLPVWELVSDPVRREWLRDEHLPLLREKQPQPTPSYEHVRRPDGSSIEVRLDWTYKHDRDGRLIGFIAVVSDITESKLAEQALVDSEQRFRQLFEHNKAVELLIDADNGHIVDANRAAERYYGYSCDHLREMTIYEINTLSRDEIDAEMQRAAAERRDHFYFRHRLASGEVRDVEVHSGPVTIGEQTILYSIVHDITERRRAEAQLLESEQRFRHLYEGVPLGYQSLGDDALLEEVNQAWLDMFGVTREQAIGRPFDEFLAPASRARFREAFDTQQHTGSVKHVLLTTRTIGGRQLVVSYAGRSAQSESVKWSQNHGILTDITAQQHAYALVQRSNRALHTLSHCNEAMIHAVSEADLLKGITRSLVTTGGYMAAWVAFGDQHQLRVAEVYAVDPTISARMRSESSDGLLGCKEVGEAMTTGQPVLAHSCSGEQVCNCWSQATGNFNAYAMAFLPLRVAENTIGVMAVYAAEPEAFDAEETALMSELANDLGYGINMLRTRDERDQIRGALSEALLQTVKALSTTVEKRDPYTAGHQERVSRLAAAIATGMGMSPERVEGIRLGGLIHDIGKVYIPAEILNRPGALSETEFAIVRSHSQVGYEIMRDVDFPWPVADMILQHHERMDGSGYPRGLKGGEIMLEARILAVADVVESISAHRPYRAARGLEAAVDEMARGRETLYDPEVVDVCGRLIHEQHFRWT
jgi:PAS domain S-box-containing protein/putative nucleotidyltransferase with HDIG domain